MSKLTGVLFKGIDELGLESPFAENFAAGDQLDAGLSFSELDETPFAEHWFESASSEGVAGEPEEFEATAVPYAGEDEATAHEMVSLENSSALLPVTDLGATIARIAEEELRRWHPGTGNLRETDQAAVAILQRYYREGVKRDVSPANLQNPAWQRQHPWSAVFISWVMRTAGAATTFAYSAAHQGYIRASRHNRLTGVTTSPFWAYRATEVAPQVGDLICASRSKSGATYDNIAGPPIRATHSDIVTEVRPGSLRVIGGNVHQNVDAKTIRTGPNGRLVLDRGQARFFAVVRCRGAIGSPLPIPPRPRPPGPVPPAPRPGLSNRGRLVVDQHPLLHGHRGTAPDLILRWNRISGSGEVDVVVHFHGYSGQKADMRLDRDKESRSGLDFSDPAVPGSTGRDRPTLAVLPRGNYFGGKSGIGYNFPALVPKGALQSLIQDALARLGRETGHTLTAGRLVLTGHSGGGAPVSAILTHTDPDEVHIFDGMYGSGANIVSWAERRIVRELSTPGPLPPAMRILYRPGSKTAPGTQPHSEAVARNVSRALQSPAAARLRPFFRVDRTSVLHNEIPGRFGWRLLANPAAELPGATAFISTGRPAATGGAVGDEAVDAREAATEVSERWDNEALAWLDVEAPGAAAEWLEPAAPEAEEFEPEETAEAGWGESLSDEGEELDSFEAFEPEASMPGETEWLAAETLEAGSFEAIAGEELDAGRVDSFGGFEPEQSGLTESAESELPYAGEESGESGEDGGELERFGEFEDERDTEWESDELEEEFEEANGLAGSGLTPAEQKAVEITSTLETGRRGGFSGLSGNFDGQGLSFGLVNWTIGTGSLQPLLNDFAAEQPRRWDSVFGPDAARVRQLMSRTGKGARQEQHRFAVAEMNTSSIVNGKPRWVVGEPWVTYFRRLSEDPEFRKIQIRYVRRLLKRGESYCRHFKLASEQAFAFMFDAVSSHGPSWLTKKFGGREKRHEKRRLHIESKLKALVEQHGEGKVPEREILLAIADVLGSTSAPRWGEKVRRRKRWFVTGRHPRARELRGLEPRPDVPYSPSAGIPVVASPGAPPKPNPEDFDSAEALEIMEEPYGEIQTDTELDSVSEPAESLEDAGEAEDEAPPSDVVDGFLESRRSLYRVALVGMNVHVTLSRSHEWTARYTNRALTEGAVGAAINTIYMGGATAAQAKTAYEKVVGQGVKYTPATMQKSGEGAVHETIIDNAAMTRMGEALNLTPRTMAEKWRAEYGEAKMIAFALGSAFRTFDRLVSYWTAKELAAAGMSLELLRHMLDKRVQSMIEVAKRHPAAASWRAAFKRNLALHFAEREPTLDDFDKVPLSQWAKTVLQLAAATRPIIIAQIKRQREEDQRHARNEQLRPHEIKVDDAAAFILQTYDATAKQRLDPYGWVVQGGQTLSNAKNEAIYLLRVESNRVIYQHLGDKKFYEQTLEGFGEELLWGVYTAAGQKSLGAIALTKWVIGVAGAIFPPVRYGVMATDVLNAAVKLKARQEQLVRDYTSVKLAYANIDALLPGVLPKVWDAVLDKRNVAIFNPLKNPDVGAWLKVVIRLVMLRQARVVSGSYAADAVNGFLQNAWAAIKRGLGALLEVLIHLIVVTPAVVGSTGVSGHRALELAEQRLKGLGVADAVAIVTQVKALSQVDLKRLQREIEDLGTHATKLMATIKDALSW